MPSIKKYNYFIISILIGSLSLTNLSCSLRIGEKASPLNEDSKQFSPGCLNNIDQIVYDYLNGKAVHKRFNQIFSCIKNALNIFKKHVYGTKKGVFTPDELRKFTHQFIMQDRTINDKLLHQLKLVKSMIVGGKLNTVTSADIDHFVELLDTLKNEALFLQPHIQSLYNLNNTMYTKHHHDNIAIDLIQSIDRISSFLNQFVGTYSFSNMHNLIHEMDILINGKAHIQNLDQKIKMIKQVYQFTNNSLSNQISPNEWKQFLHSSAYLITSGMHYLCLQKESSWITVKSTESIYLLLNNLIKFLSESTRSYPKRTIQEAHLIQLTEYLKSLDIIPKYFSQKTIHNILLMFFGKIFKELNQTNIVQLSAKQINKINHIIEYWHKLQSVLNKALQKHVLEPTKLNYISEIDLIKQNPFNKQIYTQDIVFDITDNLKQILALKPLHKTDWTVNLSHTIFLPSKKQKYNYRLLTIHHFYKTLTKMIKLGYQNTYSSKRGMKHNELVHFLTDLNPVAIDMGWYQQANTNLFNVGETEFILANTVTPSTHGYNVDWQAEEYLTEEEIIEYFSYSLSIHSSFKKILPILSKRCSSKNKNFEDQYDIQCISNNLLLILDKNLANMPDLLENIRVMHPEKRKSFTESLIHIAFDTEESYQTAKNLTQWHISNLFTSLYFVETVFNRFDTNRDSILQHEEIWQAFPVFHGYLNRTVAETLAWPEGLELAPDLYAYVIVNKKVPYQIKQDWEDQLLEDLMNQWQISSHRTWRACKDCKKWLTMLSVNWNLQMDREDLIRVFSAVIKGFVKEKYKTQAPVAY